MCGVVLCVAWCGMAVYVRACVSVRAHVRGVRVRSSPFAVVSTALNMIISIKMCSDFYN